MRCNRTRLFAMKPKAFLILLVVCSGALAILPACNILVPVVYAVEGTGKNPAEHVLEPINTLVFVDDQRNVLPRTVLRAKFAEMLSKSLVAVELVPQTVDPIDVMALVRSRERNGNRMSIESIAKEAGVKQVIFIEMETFSMTDEGWIPRPNASCLVKVLDIEKGERAYPSHEVGMLGGRRTKVQMREISPERIQGASNRRGIEMTLITTLSVDVLKLFQEHEALDLGDRLNAK